MSDNNTNKESIESIREKTQLYEKLAEAHREKRQLKEEVAKGTILTAVACSLYFIFGLKK
jgi:hypothetical protein